MHVVREATGCSLTGVVVSHISNGEDLDYPYIAESKWHLTHVLYDRYLPISFSQVDRKREP